MAYADLNRHEDILPILRSVLDVEDPLQNKHTFPKDVIEKLEKSFESITNKDLQMDFQRILKFLRDNKHVSETETLDGLLCSEVLSTSTGNPTREYQSRDRNMVAANFRNRSDGQFRYNNRDNNDNRGRNDNYQRRNRPGLRDLY